MINSTSGINSFFVEAAFFSTNIQTGKKQPDIRTIQLFGTALIYTTGPLGW